MGENLVVMKSVRQRTLEGWLCLAVPLLLSGGIRLFAPGWALLGGVLGFSAYLLIPGIGGAVANRLPGGERVTVDERARRTYETLLAQSPWRMVPWMALGYISWIGSLFLAIVSFHHPVIEAILAGSVVVVGVLTALFAFYGMRRSHRRLGDAMREHWPAQSLRQWLPAYLLVHYGCLFGAMAVGYGLGRLCAPPLGLAVFAAGYLVGVLLEAVIRARLRSRSRQPLWTQFGVLQALGLAVLQLGLPMAALAAAIPSLMGYAGWYPALVFGTGGLVFGTVVILLMWITANLSVAGARRTGS